MAIRYEDVVIQWLDDPNTSLGTRVGIGDWVEKEDDPDVFFYFSNEEEFEMAKQPKGIEDFRIIDIEEN
jgi:hypothetical protein